MNLWIVGQYLGDSEDGVAWDFQGVFDSESAAIAACRDSSYFVASATLNEELPHETVEWDTCYYPKASTEA